MIKLPLKNPYGYLYVNKRDGAYFLELSDFLDNDWVEISEELYNLLLKELVTNGDSNRK